MWALRARFRIPTGPGLGSIPRSRSVTQADITPRLPSVLQLAITSTDAAPGAFQDNSFGLNFPMESRRQLSRWTIDDPRSGLYDDARESSTLPSPTEPMPRDSRPASSGSLPPLELRAFRPNPHRRATRTLRGHRVEDALYDAFTQADAHTRRPTQAGFFRDAAT